MKKQRVLIAVSESGVIPENADKASEKDFELFKAAADVSAALDKLGHEWQQIGLWDELVPLRDRLADYKPTIVFNLVDQFRYQTIYDQHIVSYLELLRTAFTGCNPRGLVLASDKALSKKILFYHRVRTPGFQSFPVNRKVKLTRKLKFPLIVKVHLEEASAGISQASIVNDADALAKRVSFVHDNFHTSAIAEEYIDGREISVSVIGNQRLQVLPPWELFMNKLPPDSMPIATERVKWNLDYQEKYGIRLGPATRLADDVKRKLERTSRRIYRALNLSGYARIDYRLDKDNNFYFLEANANPDISSDEELASAAKAARVEYPALIQKILNLGLRWAESF